MKNASKFLTFNSIFFSLPHYPFVRLKEFISAYFIGEILALRTLDILIISAISPHFSSFICSIIKFLPSLIPFFPSSFLFIEKKEGKFSYLKSLVFLHLITLDGNYFFFFNIQITYNFNKFLLKKFLWKEKNWRQNWIYCNDRRISNESTWKFYAYLTEVWENGKISKAL